MAEPSEIEAEQKKLESKFHPIMTRIYQAASGAPEGAEGAERRSYEGAGQQPGPTPQQNVDDLD